MLSDDREEKCTDYKYLQPSPINQGTSLLDANYFVLKQTIQKSTERRGANIEKIERALAYLL